MSSPSIAFFDVDYTLVKGNSGYYTSLRLIRHRILKKRRIFQAAYYQLTMFLLRHDVKKIYEIAAVDMAGRTLDDVLKIGRECFEEDVRPRFYREGLEAVERHKKRGDKIVLLTSSPYMTIRIVQDYLGADAIYTNGPVIVDGVLTDRVRVPLCHGPGKIHYAQEASRRFGIPLEHCSFYTDHHSDIPLLELVGHPHVVNPDKKLLKVAVDRGWPVMRFR